MAILKIDIRESGLFSPTKILIAYSFVDFILPFFARLILKSEPKIDWITPIRNRDMIEGVLYYSFFYIVMICFSLMKFKSHNFSFALNENRFRLISWIVIFLWFSKSYADISNAGGAVDWFAKKVISRWTGAIDLENDSIKILTYLKWDYILAFLSFILYYFRSDLSKYKILFYSVPILALISCLMTFYRGAVLNVFLGYLFLYYMLNYGLMSKKIIKIRIIFGVFLVVIIFGFFGLIRSAAEESFKDEVKDDAELSSLIIQGSGLTSVTHIVNYYKSGDQFFYGKTYLDMMLLPVPRFIYTSKPEWYGVDDITRQMGWPESTQSAVTLPGEAYANFGILGLIIAPLYGLFFSLISSNLTKKKPGWLIWYATVGLSGLGILNWMSFTGLINQVFTSLVLIVLWFCIKK